MLLVPTQGDALDMWDPRTWGSCSHEHRIYGDDRAQTWAIVDEEDYQWALQWCWCLNIKKSRGNPLKTKAYMRRAVGENANGQRLRTYTVYLHLEILKRSGAIPPSDQHIIGDHRNGHSLDCRRSNLRWATHSMNSRNVHGRYAKDLVDG